jgi:hypothetical protein
MQPGDSIAGRFQIRGRTSSGAMSTVYATVDRETGLPTAVKLMRATPPTLLTAPSAHGRRCPGW